MNQEIIVVCDNIRSLYNVGSIFRSSDALGFDEIYLCGITGTPEHQRFAKTALAATDALPWHHRQSAVRTVKRLKERGFTIVALEISPRSRKVMTVDKRPLAIVIGHEINGIDPRILAIADHVFHIPMKGAGHSLNVAVAFGIGGYIISQ